MVGSAGVGLGSEGVGDGPTGEVAGGLLTGRLGGFCAGAGTVSTDSLSSDLVSCSDSLASSVESPSELGDQIEVNITLPTHEEVEILT